MPSLLSKLTACGLIAGGFAVTGDLGRIAGRGFKLLEATGVPAASQPPDLAGGHATVLPAPPATPAPAPSAPAAQAPAPPAPAAAPPARAGDLAPVARPADHPRRPVSTPASVDLRSLRPGQRLTIWAGAPAAAYAFDVVDPLAGEVLERAATSGRPGAAPRRLRLVADSATPARIALGSTLSLVPLGIASRGTAAGPADTLGPVRALETE